MVTSWGERPSDSFKELVHSQSAGAEIKHILIRSGAYAPLGLCLN